MPDLHTHTTLRMGDPWDGADWSPEPSVKVVTSIAKQEERASLCTRPGSALSILQYISADDQKSSTHFLFWLSVTKTCAAVPWSLHVWCRKLVGGALMRCSWSAWMINVESTYRQIVLCRVQSENTEDERAREGAEDKHACVAWYCADIPVAISLHSQVHITGNAILYT